VIAATGASNERIVDSGGGGGGASVVVDSAAVVVDSAAVVAGVVMVVVVVVAGVVVVVSSASLPEHPAAIRTRTTMPANFLPLTVNLLKDHAAAAYATDVQDLPITVLEGPASDQEANRTGSKSAGYADG
jgi:hypothetical protein